MKVTLFSAISLNGFIARKNGDEDFLSDENWQSFTKEVNSFNNLIIGRRTFEAVQKWDNAFGFADFKQATKIVISSDENYKLDPTYILASSPKQALEILQSKGFENILIAGGSTLNTSFAKDNLIDEIILNVESVVIDEGIPLFANKSFDLHLQLLESKQISSNIIQLHYMVVK